MACLSVAPTERPDLVLDGQVAKLSVVSWVDNTTHTLCSSSTLQQQFSSRREVSRVRFWMAPCRDGNIGSGTLNMSIDVKANPADARNNAAACP